jgi:hypothetical protein
MSISDSLADAGFQIRDRIAWEMASKAFRKPPETYRKILAVLAVMDALGSELDGADPPIPSLRLKAANGILRVEVDYRGIPTRAEMGCGGDDGELLMQDYFIKYFREHDGSTEQLPLDLSSDAAG